MHEMINQNTRLLSVFAIVKQGFGILKTAFKPLALFTVIMMLADALLFFLFNSSSLTFLVPFYPAIKILAVLLIVFPFVIMTLEKSSKKYFLKGITNKPRFFNLIFKYYFLFIVMSCFTAILFLPVIILFTMNNQTVGWLYAAFVGLFWGLYGVQGFYYSLSSVVVENNSIKTALKKGFSGVNHFYKRTILLFLVVIIIGIILSIIQIAIPLLLIFGVSVLFGEAGEQIVNAPLFLNTIKSFAVFFYMWITFFHLSLYIAQYVNFREKLEAPLKKENEVLSE